MSTLPKQIQAWAAMEPGKSLVPFTFNAPQSLKNDQILIEVKHCGICHSDIHLIDNDWKVSHYPLIAGHEILGTVKAKGSSVTHLNLGDNVGVGWQSSSCMNCHYCVTGRENLCAASGASCLSHSGGFADFHITDGRFAFKIPEAINLAETAPLLCGGATVFSPLREFVNSDDLYNTHVGVVGVGGLGHLALKFAKRMGFEVTAFSSNQNKAAELKVLGADHVVSSTQETEILKMKGKLDLVLVTIPYDLNWNAYLKTLRPDGTLCFVGVPPTDLQFPVRQLLGGRLRVTASPIAGRARIEEMLTFCARHRIGAQSEVFAMKDINNALDVVRSGKIRFRAVVST